MSSEQTALKTSTHLRRRLSLRPYIDILFLAGLALLLPGLLLLPFPPLRVPLGLVGIFLAPGNAVLSALFPRGQDLSTVERAALTFGLSVAILPVLALLLNALPWGIRPWPMVLSLSILILIFCGIGAIRRYMTEPVKEAPDEALISPATRWRSLDGHTRRKIIGGLMVITCLFITIGFVLITPDPTQKFSEFYMLGADGLVENYPNQVAPGEQIQIPVGITNHEGTIARYRVEVHSGANSLAWVGPILLEHGQTWENRLNFSMPAIGDDHPVDILLYYEDDNTVYRSLRLWIDVR